MPNNGLGKIVAYLKDSAGYLSGEEISRQMKISRSGIWKYIRELRQMGYGIEAVPHRGYRLSDCPDCFFPWEVRAGLQTHVIGFRVIYREYLRSTMDEAFRLGQEGAPDGTVVCAETQSRGRGRLGRSWASPPGQGIYLSMILRPQVALSGVSQLTLLCAVALCEAVNRSSPVKARIKWPNDLMAGGKKLAGILTELNAELDRVKFLVVGIGLNVNTFPSQIPPEATSLKIETGQTYRRVELLQEILRSFDRWYLFFQENGYAGIRERWKELAETIGQRVRVTDPAGVTEGRVTDLDSDGGLLIRNDAGLTVKKMAGDVVHLR